VDYYKTSKFRQRRKNGYLLIEVMINLILKLERFLRYFYPGHNEEGQIDQKKLLETTHNLSIIAGK